MAQLVVSNAQLTCSFGTSPSVLTVIPTGSPVQAGKQPAGTIMDFKPMANIKPFGMCNTLSNPQVASATSAAQGVLTPQPCVPVTTSPWTPGSTTVMIGNMPALTSTSRCMCTWGGSISITSPGQTTVSVP